MIANQSGDPIVEELLLFPDEFQEGELAEAILLLVAKLGCQVRRTNANKSGTPRIELRSNES